jgi:uncharacterized protein DUF732
VNVSTYYDERSKMRRVTMFVAVFVLVLSGCSFTISSTPSTTPSVSPSRITKTPSTPRPTNTPTPEVPSSPEPYEPELIRVRSLDDALPSPAPRSVRADLNSTNAYDADYEVVGNYFRWVVYETPLQSHAYTKKHPKTRPLTTNTIYKQGLRVCKDRREGHSEAKIVKALERKGYTNDIAPAIVKAALNALCPRLNRGYMTQFDQDTEQFYRAVTPLIRFTGERPDIFAHGEFTKDVCYFLDGEYPGQIFENLRTQYSPSELAESLDENDGGTLRILVDQAAKARCPGLFGLVPQHAQAIQ